MKMKRYIIACLLAGSGALMTSCGDYLDIVPDNVISLEEIFKTRKGAEEFLQPMPLFHGSGTQPTVVLLFVMRWIFPGLNMRRTLSMREV